MVAPDHSDDPLVEISMELLRAGNQRVFGNKIVLAFECRHERREVLDWLEEYNKENDIKLTLHDKLRNYLFVVEFDENLGAQAKKQLLQASPLCAMKTYASANDYTPQFDADDPQDFSYLITVQIRPGSPQIYEFLTFIFEPVGKVVRAKMEPGCFQHLITALVETQLRIFPANIRFRVSESTVMTIPLDYDTVNQRCRHCFTYDHLGIPCLPFRNDD